jgi:predicted RNase H-like HicB family nuclease
MEYIAYLHKDKNSDYGVSFPDFPGCITAGSTLEEARKMAAEALAMHVTGMRADGEPIPEPSTLDELRGDPAMKGAEIIRHRLGMNRHPVHLRALQLEAVFEPGDHLVHPLHGQVVRQRAMAGD